MSEYFCEDYKLEKHDKKLCVYCVGMKKEKVKSQLAAKTRECVALALAGKEKDRVLLDVAIEARRRLKMPICENCDPGGESFEFFHEQVEDTRKAINLDGSLASSKQIVEDHDKKVRAKLWSDLNEYRDRLVAAQKEGEKKK